MTLIDHFTALILQIFQKKIDGMFVLGFFHQACFDFLISNCD